MLIRVALSMAVGYLLGSLSPSYFLGIWLRGIDIRTVGFKNAGVRNVKTVLGLWPAVITACIDLGKGIAAMLIALRLLDIDPLFTVLPVAAAVAGHVFPFYLRFRGGKGTATAIGVFLYITVLEILLGSFSPLSLAVLLLVALLSYLASRCGDVAAIVTFGFMLILTPLELGFSGNGLLNIGLSVYMLSMNTWLAVRHGVFSGGDERLKTKLWRIIARPFALLFVLIDMLSSRTVTLIVLGTVAAGFVVLDFIRLFTKVEMNTIYRKGERRKFSSMTAFLSAGFMCFLLFPGSMPYYALAYVTIGDMFSKLIGIRYGRTRIFRDRTLQGTLGFLSGSMAAGYILYMISPIPLAAVAIGCVTAAVTEVFSEALDDNFTVSLVSGGAMYGYTYFTHG